MREKEREGKEKREGVREIEKKKRGRAGSNTPLVLYVARQQCWEVLQCVLED